MSKNIIFYFTGTGNSLQITRDIAGKLTDCEVASIPRYGEKSLGGGYERIGFVFPVYFLGMPNCVKNFIKETDFSANKNAYYFTAINYGGTKGGAIYDLKKLLQDKQIMLNAGFGIRMPSNYVVLYDMQENKVKDEVLEKAKSPVESAAEIIKRKASTKLPAGSNFIYRFYNSLYKSDKIANKDSGYVVSENCNGCGICQSVCPVKNIEMPNGKPSFRHKCEQCVACIQFCPQRAINYKNRTQNRRRYTNPDVTVKDLSE
ncbi:MAG: EFR1 family ferrodoxin [Oscillospiraceae bacterium]|nr:EFR1 family ferrodoxin [Oscillospiraceae bacterium]